MELLDRWTFCRLKSTGPSDQPLCYEYVGDPGGPSEPGVEVFEAQAGGEAGAQLHSEGDGSEGQGEVADHPGAMFGESMGASGGVAAVCGEKPCEGEEAEAGV